MASHEFQVYRHTDGSFRSRLVDQRGRIVRFPISQLSKELDAEDAKFFRRNVQAALAERFRANADQANHETPAGTVRFFNADKGLGIITMDIDNRSDGFAQISSIERARLDTAIGTFKEADDSPVKILVEIPINAETSATEPTRIRGIAKASTPDKEE